MNLAYLRQSGLGASPVITLGLPWVSRAGTAGSVLTARCVHGDLLIVCDHPIDQGGARCDCSPAQGACRDEMAGHVLPGP